MPTTDPDSRLQVVVGLLQNGKGKYLVQQRQLGKPCAGQWEFPGGKIEKEETGEQALQRELFEELDIRVTDMLFLTQVSHDYEHASVLLHVYQITAFEQTARGKEGQIIAWESVDNIRTMDVLPAVFPILNFLE